MNAVAFQVGVLWPWGVCGAEDLSEDFSEVVAKGFSEDVSGDFSEGVAGVSEELLS